MNQQRWQKIQTLLDQLFDLPIAKQEAYIAQTCDEDPSLAIEVRGMLAADLRSNDLLNGLVRNSDKDHTVTVMHAVNTINQYDIIQKIGIGGMGVVYQVWDKRLERYCALKYLNPKLITNTELRNQFTAEARAASRIDHPNICTIYDIGALTEKQLYFTMPFYSGQDLATRIAAQQISPLAMANFAQQIAAGLEAAHAQNIRHGDIKPANIMITSEKTVKILDFGIATIMNHDPTASHLLAGSTAYMPPEQILGRRTDRRSDIWAYGVVLYEMFTGKLPFSGKDNAQITQQILSGQVIPLSKHPQAPQNKTLATLLSRTLQLDPQNRVNNIAELRPILQHLNRELQTASDNQQAKPHNRATQSSRILSKRVLAALPSFARNPGLPIPETNRLGNEAFLANRPTLFRPVIDEHQHSAAGMTKNQTQKTEARDQQSRDQPLRSQGGNPITSTQAIQLDKILCSYLGPVGRIVLRRYQRQTKNVKALCTALARQIDSEDARDQFLQRTRELWEKNP